MIWILATTVTDQLGNQFDSTTPAGAYWVGFGVGVMIFGFGYIVRFARRTGDRG